MLGALSAYATLVHVRHSLRPTGFSAWAALAFLLTALTVWAWLPRLWEQALRLGARQRLWTLGTVLLIGLLLLRTVPVLSPRGASQERGTLLHAVLGLLFHAGHLLPLGFVLLAAWLWARTSPPGAATPPGPPRAAVLRYALPPLLGWSALGVVLFPGLLSSDSVDQWQQALHGPLFDHHPLFHTLLLRLFQQVWPNPALVTGAQVLGLSLLVGWACASLRAAGASGAAVWASSLLAALSPALGLLAITLWKDVAFTAMVLALVILVFRAGSGLRDPRGWGWWAGLCLCSVAALLLRHNGQPAVLGAFAAVLWLHRRSMRRPLLLLGLTLAVAVGARIVLNAVTGTRPPPTMIALLGYTAAHVAQDTPLQPAERSLLEQVRPLDDDWKYLCWTSDHTLFDGRINSEALRQHDRELIRLTLRLALRAPATTLRHFRCASELAWSIRAGRAPFGTVALSGLPDGRLSTIYPGPGAPSSAHPWPDLAQHLLKAAVWTAQPEVSWLFWRPALYLYLLMIGAVLAAAKLRALWPLLGLSPVVAHTAGMALVMVSQDARYLMPTLLVAVVFVPGLLTLPRPTAAGVGPAA